MTFAIRIINTESETHEYRVTGEMHEYISTIIEDAVDKKLTGVIEVDYDCCDKCFTHKYSCEFVGADGVFGVKDNNRGVMVAWFAYENDAMRFILTKTMCDIGHIECEESSKPGD
jgi:hypothetical protein